MNTLQVLKSNDSVVVSEHKTVQGLKEWLEENCYSLFERSLHLKATDERVWVRYNGAEPSPNVNILTVGKLLDKISYSLVQIMGESAEEEDYWGDVDDIPEDASFLKYEVKNICAGRGGVICIYYKN